MEQRIKHCTKKKPQLLSNDLMSILSTLEFKSSSNSPSVYVRMPDFSPPQQTLAILDGVLPHLIWILPDVQLSLCRSERSVSLGQAVGRLRRVRVVRRDL